MKNSKQEPKPYPWTNTKKQTETLHYLRDLVTNEILFGGGAGGAKSTLGCYWLLSSCIKYPGSRWLLGRSKLKTLMETTFMTLLEVAQKLPVRLSINHQRGQITVISQAGESLIIMKDLFAYPSDPDFTSLGSLEITGAFIDEVNEITYKAFEVVRTRIRYKLDEFGVIPKILGTCNPARNWVKEKFYDPHRRGSLKKNRMFVQALVRDNPFISKHYVRNLEQLDDPVLKSRLLDGNWDYDDTEGLLIPYDNAVNIFSNTWVPVGAGYITADIAFQGSDKFVVIVWSGFKIIHFTVMAKSNPKEVENQIRASQLRFRVPMSHTAYDADGVGGFLSGYMRDAVAFKNGSQPLYQSIRKEREEYLNLKAQCYFHAAKAINDGRVFFQPDPGQYRDEIVQELSTIKNSSIGTDKKLAIQKKEDWKKEIGRSPDFADAIAMRWYFEVAPQAVSIRRTG